MYRYDNKIIAFENNIDGDDDGDECRQIEKRREEKRREEKRREEKRREEYIPDGYRECGDIFRISFHTQQ